jgi:hypothetical protein
MRTRDPLNCNILNITGYLDWRLYVVDEHKEKGPEHVF